MSVLVVDFGGSHIACALVHQRQVLAAESVKLDATDLLPLMPAISAGLHRCMERGGSRAGSLKGVAIGFCGLVGSGPSPAISVLDKFVDAAAFDWQGWAMRGFGVPLRIENDARLALLGEARAGAAQGLRDVVLVSLGTGIGGAAMVNGELLRSRSGHAGALGGHLPVALHGRACPCGATGCAEAEASTWALPELCREHTGFAASLLSKEKTLNFETLMRVAATGDPVANGVWKHCLHVWSVLTLALIYVYGPEMVLFTGGVLCGDVDILGPIRAYVAEHMWKTHTGVPRVERGVLGAQAALLGGEFLFTEMTV